MYLNKDLHKSVFYTSLSFLVNYQTSHSEYLASLPRSHCLERHATFPYALRDLTKRLKMGKIWGAADCWKCFNTSRPPAVKTLAQS